MAQRIKDAASAYTTPAEALARLGAEADLRVREYRDRLEREDEEEDGGQTSGGKPAKPAGGPGSSGKANANKGKGKSGRQRTRRRGEGSVRPEPEAEAA